MGFISLVKENNQTKFDGQSCAKVLKWGLSAQEIDCYGSQGRCTIAPLSILPGGRCTSWQTKSVWIVSGVLSTNTNTSNHNNSNINTTIIIIVNTSPGGRCTSCWTWQPTAVWIASISGSLLPRASKSESESQIFMKKWKWKNTDIHKSESDSPQQSG